MKFNELSWGAVCFYYRFAGDSKYCNIVRDTDFLSRLRTTPAAISTSEFEQKVILDYVDIENYDLLSGKQFAANILAKIDKLYPEISSLKDVALVDCDFSDRELLDKINMIYVELSSVYGLWVTGVSKITHILNDRLFVLTNSKICEKFKISEDNIKLVEWMKVTQRVAKEVVLDFQEQGLSGSPEQFLSDKLGYADLGCHKSLIKFIDEYFWLHFGDNLPIPPRWVPPFTGEDTSLRVNR